MASSTIKDLLAGFGDDGEIITPDLDTSSASRKRIADKKTDRWATDANFYLGVARRTDNHPLAPPARIIEEQVVDNDDTNTNEMMKLLATSRHVFIYGPHGTGKTQLVKYVNAQLCRPLYQNQGHEHLEWQDIVGTYHPDEDGNGRWDYGPLVLAMINGGTYLLDEGVAVRQGILNGLNDVLNSRELTLTNHIGFEKIVPAEGFSIVVTANPWDRYAGNNQMNVAYLDRFFVRYKTYMKKEAEERLLKEKYPTVPGSAIHQLTNLAATLRAASEKDPESDLYVISTRMLQTICDSIENFGLTVMESIQRNVFSIVKLTAPDQLASLQSHVSAAIRA